MFEKEVTIKNSAGIHCRPSSMILAAVENFPGHEFKIDSEKGGSTLGSIMELLALGLQRGDKVKISVSGPDENEAGVKMAGLFSHEFDFPSN
jgi:phosphotransferase system HPr (HPr) family protein